MIGEGCFFRGSFYGVDIVFGGNVLEWFFLFFLGILGVI